MFKHKTHLDYCGSNIYCDILNNYMYCLLSFYLLFLFDLFSVVFL